MPHKVGQVISEPILGFLKTSQARPKPFPLEQDETSTRNTRPIIIPKNVNSLRRE